MKLSLNLKNKKNDIEKSNGDAKSSIKVDQEKKNLIMTVAGGVLIAGSVIMLFNSAANFKEYNSNNSQSNSMKVEYASRMEHFRVYKSNLLKEAQQMGISPQKNNDSQLQILAKNYNFELPIFALKYNIKLEDVKKQIINKENFTFGTDNSSKYPGIKYVKFQISGTYKNLDQLINFLHFYKESSVKSIRITGSNFAAIIYVIG